MDNKISNLEKYAMKYWNISSAFEGRWGAAGKIITRTAIEDLNEALTYLNPERKVASNIAKLQQQIIIGARECRRRKTQPVKDCQLIQFILK